MLQIFRQQRCMNTMEAETIQKNAASPKSHTIRKNWLLFICIPLFLASCSTAKIYTKPDALSYTTRYKKLAVVPPKINIKINTRKDVVENIQAQEMREAVNAQNEIYSCLLNFVQKRNVYLDIMPIEQTNAKFIELGNPYSVSPQELAKELGVDAVIYMDGLYGVQNNVFGGIAMAIMLFPAGTLYGIMYAFSYTYFINLNMKLYDGATGSLLYNYKDQFHLTAYYSQKDDNTYPSIIGKATKKIIKKSPIYMK